MTASDHPLPLLRGNHPAALSNYVVTRCSRLLWNVAGANEGMEFFILIFINFILHLKVFDSAIEKLYIWNNLTV